MIMNKVFRFVLILFVLILAVSFVSVRASAAAAQDPAAKAYWALDDDTRALMRAAGVDPDDLGALANVTPESLFSVLRELFGIAAAEKARLFGGCLTVILLMRLFSGFMPSSRTEEFAETAGALVIVLIVLSGSAAVAQGCVRAIGLTKDMMLALIPALGAVAAFSGKPVTAMGVQTLVFSYAEGVCVLFSELLTPVTASGAALGCAAAISPLEGIDRFAAALHKLVKWLMALAAGVFSAVLALRGVLGSAADGAAMKGLRFVVSGAVPVVGSALADALSSLTAGLSAVCGSAAAVGVLGTALICLPPLCGTLVWKLALLGVSACAELFGVKKVPQFVAAFVSVFNILSAAVLFNAAVFVIALAIIAKIRGGVI